MLFFWCFSVLLMFILGCYDRFWGFEGWFVLDLSAFRFWDCEDLTFFNLGVSLFFCFFGLYLGTIIQTLISVANIWLQTCCHTSSTLVLVLVCPRGGSKSHILYGFSRWSAPWASSVNVFKFTFSVLFLSGTMVRGQSSPVNKRRGRHFAQFLLG